MIERREWEGRCVRGQRALRMRGPVEGEREERKREEDAAHLKCLLMKIL